METCNTLEFVPPELWAKIPAEIWQKILTMIHSINDPKYTVARRLVCKTWRDVIDEHLDFQVIVVDKTIKAKLNKSQHVRFRCWIVQCLTKPKNLEELISNQKGALVKELRLHGLITPHCFQGVARSTTNLEKFSITDFALSKNGVLEPAFGQEPEFAAFCYRLKTVNVATGSFQNLEKFLQLRLPKLLNFKLTMPFSGSHMHQSHKYINVITFMEGIFAFLENACNIKSFKMQLQLCGLFKKGNNFSFQRNWSALKLPDVQLESLDLAAATQLLFFWAPVIQAQRKLKSINIYNYREFAPIPLDDKLLLFDNLMKGLVLNGNTLSSIYLFNIEARAPLNASVFENMKSLKKLRLLLVFGSNVEPVISNLSKLPDSLQNVMLTGITCLTDDLLEMAKKLANLTHMQLINFKVKNQFSEDVAEVGINQQVVNTLVGKRHIKYLCLSRINLERISYVEINGKTFCEISDNCKGNLRLEVDVCNQSIRYSFK